MRTEDFRPSGNVDDDRATERVARRRRHSGRRLRARHRHRHHHRADQLFRHRPERAAQRRANSLRRRLATLQTLPAPHVAAGTPTDATGRFVAHLLGAPMIDRRSSPSPASRPSRRNSSRCRLRGALRHRADRGCVRPPARPALYLETAPSARTSARWRRLASAALRVHAGPVIAPRSIRDASASAAAPRARS